MVTLAVIAIITVVGLPSFLSYWRSASLKGGTQELTTILNQARQIAISRNTDVCVRQAANTVQILVGGCAGTAWTGPGTDASGTIRLQNSVNVTSTTANVAFDYLGAAKTPGTYTVQNPIDGSTMRVTVALSGRVTTGP
jgi:Tfp pilus assembly protein FimT